jgi:hypothetical protein
VLVTGDWDSVGTVVDVGGGTGALLAEILRARPDIQDTLEWPVWFRKRELETYRI